MSNNVVISPCYGGFGLSDAAERLLYNMGYRGNPWNIPRHDPRLIRVVEHLGDRASGDFAELKIVRLRGSVYMIEEYDGYESAVEPDDLKWIRIP